MSRLLALLIAATALPLHAATLVPRDVIFPATYQGRPAISSSGLWLAVEAPGAAGLRLVPTATAATPLDVSLPPGMTLYWYRWAHTANDTLTLGVGGAYDGVFSYNVATATLARITSEDMTASSITAGPTNNYAFTYNQYKDKSTGTYWDLGLDGALHAALADSEMPGYVSGQGRYFKMIPGARGWALAAGAAEGGRSNLIVSPDDQRLGGGLVSLSNDGVAYVLTSDGGDMLDLVSMDMATGTRKLLAHAPVDIRRVILDPATLTPDAIEYDDGGPQLVLLNQQIADDIKLLSARGDGFPAIVDRSPNDRFWVIQ